MTDPIRIRTSVASDLGTLHRDTGLLGRLLADVPDWAIAAKAINLLAEHKPVGGVATQTDVLDGIAGLILSHVEAGNPPPEDLHEQAAAARAELETRGLVAAAHVRAASLLAPQLDGALRDSEDHLYAALDDLLQDVLDQARGINAPEQLLDPATVLATGRADEYETWNTLATTHGQIRAAQSKIAGKVSGHDVSNSTEALVMRGVDQVFPHWAPWRVRGYLVAKHNQRERMPLTAPWPLQGLQPTQLRLTSDAGAPEFLVWALKAKAQLWVPTTKQHREEVARLAVLRSDPDAEVEPLLSGEGTEYVAGTEPERRRRPPASSIHAGGAWDPPPSGAGYGSDISVLVGDA